MRPVTIYRGDCLEVIPRLADGSVRAVITDPPYGMNYRTNRTAVRGPAIGGDADLTTAHQLLLDMLATVSDKLLSNAWMYLFAGDRLRDRLVGAGTVAYDELIWAKPIGTGDTTGQRYRPSYERIVVIRKGRPLLNGHPGNLIWGDRPGRTTKMHAAQKGLFGLAELIEQCSVPGDVILDPFGGSGSLAAAMCILLPQSEWRQIILIEQDEQMAAQAARRLAPYTEVEVI